MSNLLAKLYFKIWSWRALAAREEMTWPVKAAIQQRINISGF